MIYGIITDAELCQEWVAKKYNIVGKELTVCIGLQRNNELIAVCGYNNFNGVSCHAHYYHDTNYAPARFLWFIHYYPFVQCGLKMMIAITHNPKMVKLAEKLGYIFEGVLVNAHPQGDLAIGTLTKENCRFITARYARGLS